MNETTKIKLEDLAKFIEELPPARLEMGAWSNIYKKFGLGFEDVFPDCGTACCLAGWICLRAGYKLEGGTVYENHLYMGFAPIVAQREVGSPEDDLHLLFYTEDWPDAFLPATPKSAARRIRYFIKEGK